MPSDLIRSAASDSHKAAADASLERFRSSLATTLSQLRGLLADRSGDAAVHTKRTATSLGTFAGGRVDAARFAAFTQAEDHLHADATVVLEAAVEALEALHAEGRSLNQWSLEPGNNLRCLVGRGLRHLGIAFGVAKAVQLARAGAYVEKEHAKLLKGFPFRDWSPEQRALAPLVLIRVADGDAQITNLGEFLDAGMKVLVDFEERCTAAPMARLITPGTFVVQDTDGAALEDFLSWSGAGAYALVVERCARFAHDPRAGVHLAERLRVDYLPDDRPARHCGSLSVTQQEQDLDHLRSLAQAATPLPVAEDVSEPAPADKLAALLLNKAHLEEV